MEKNKVLIFFSLFFILLGCNEKDAEQSNLPYFGVHDLEIQTDSNGKKIGADTIYYTVPKFHMINQDSVQITHHDFENKIYIADFFFTTCPSICPAKTRQLSRIQDSLIVHSLFGNKVKLISHTVDPDRDTPSVLKQYASIHNIDTKNWYLVTEEKEYLYRIAKEGYMATAFADEDAEGGFFHTDQFVLLDKERHIRGFYDGTDPMEVDQLWNDIQKLLEEKNTISK